MTHISMTHFIGCSPWFYRCHNGPESVFVPPTIVVQSYRRRQLLGTRPAAKPNHEADSLIPIWILSSNFSFGLPLHLGYWPSSSSGSVFILLHSLRIGQESSVRLGQPSASGSVRGLHLVAVRIGRGHSWRIGSAFESNRYPSVRVGVAHAHERRIGSGGVSGSVRIVCSNL